MTEKKIQKETTIHKTEFIDKELPKIYYEKTQWTSMSIGMSEVISVSDKSSEKALETFRKIREKSK